MSVPIIFIHYNDSYYLKYSLESAVIFNPDKKVILLGDDTNSHYSNLGVVHYNINNFNSGYEIDLFNRVYRFIAGKNHARPDWTYFVFRRWFIMYNFIIANNIQTFWTFDSDNLILTNLSGQEKKFCVYDFTEQCAGMCINGFVNNVKLVKGYLDKINELFERTPFLQEQEAFLEHSPYYAYTEMGAYISYRAECSINRIRLNTIIDNETFLDCICTVTEHKSLPDEDEYEIYDEKLFGGHQLKKIYLSSDGDIFMRHLPTAQLVKMNTINMSWTPEWLFDALLQHARRKLSLGKPQKPSIKVFDLAKHLSENLSKART